MVIFMKMEMKKLWQSNKSGKFMAKSKESFDIERGKKLAVTDLNGHYKEPKRAVKGQIKSKNRKKGNKGQKGQKELKRTF